MTEDVARQCQQYARLGGMGHDLGGRSGRQLAKLHLTRTVEGSIHKHDHLRLGDGVCQLGCE